MGFEFKFFFPSVLEFELRAYILCHSTSTFFVCDGFFKIRSQSLQPRDLAGFKPKSFCSLFRITGVAMSHGLQARNSVLLIVLIA
jgi:hypothetical protein